MTDQIRMSAAPVPGDSPMWTTKPGFYYFYFDDTTVEIIT